MKDPSVAEMWASFAVNVMPLGVSKIQKRELRRAFYAGAWGMLMGCMSLSSRDAKDVLKVLEDLRREREAFRDSVLEGRA